MESGGKYTMGEKVDMDETYVVEQDEGDVGRNEGKKKIVVVAIENQGKGVSRMYEQVIETSSRENLKSFMKDNFRSGAYVRTDKWAG